MIRLTMCLACVLFAATAYAEAKWQKLTGKDELTDDSTDMVAVFSEEPNSQLMSTFCIEFKDGEPKSIGLLVGKLERIVPPILGSSDVAVTYRSKGAPKHTGTWKLFPSNREIHLQPPTKKAAIEMISGESLIIQVDHSGKRYTFDLSGPNGDRLRKYVEQKFAISK